MPSRRSGWPRPYRAPTSGVFGGPRSSQYQHPTPAPITHQGPVVNPHGPSQPGPSGHAPPPAAAPAPGPGGPPLDPTYEGYLANARYNRQLADAQALYQTGQIQQQYGLEDHSNPYSRAALLEETYKRSKLGTTNQMASAGQLYSGAYGKAEGEVDRNYSISYDQLARQYADQLHGVQFGQAQSYANFGMGVDDQALKALLRALSGGK